ncbi:MAG: hypothetical protein E6H53_13880, partial [Betaproteobacteria bacterium]
MNAASQGIARNAACPCGSGERFKACCGSRASRHDMAASRNGLRSTSNPWSKSLAPPGARK